MDKVYAYFKETKILWEERPPSHLETKERQVLIYITMQGSAKSGQHG